MVEELPDEHGQIDEEQIFILGLDAPAKEQTIRRARLV